ncbi:hypothetical protein D9756_005164 [Leucocoprinus leucothites]|uniref:Uncharacterized protein n=1 Tax=Leucocoprinus leucothites TaxID=201217 RepID=A0A8H5G9P4_9AGAR|nr:hypothetical protein D9756_005164 [Leucoagaricus leucothites]
MQLPSLFSIASLLCILSHVQGQTTPPMQHAGTMFIFDPGLGACGFSNTSSQIVASVSQQVFRSFPGATPNPNKNPICRRKATIKYDGKSLTAAIVDFFPDNGPAQHNIGLSLPGFTFFAPESDGIVPNVTWSIV